MRRASFELLLTMSLTLAGRWEPPKQRLINTCHSSRLHSQQQRLTACAARAAAGMADTIQEGDYAIFDEHGEKKSIHVISHKG